MKSMNSFIGDELAHKVKVLSRALSEAEKMIQILELENDSLKDALISLASENNEDLVLDSEAICV